MSAWAHLLHACSKLQETYYARVVNVWGTRMYGYECDLLHACSKFIPGECLGAVLDQGRMDQGWIVCIL